jgi:hypothetical protein
MGKIDDRDLDGFALIIDGRHEDLHERLAATIRADFTKARVPLKGVQIGYGVDARLPNAVVVSCVEPPFDGTPFQVAQKAVRALTWLFIDIEKSQQLARATKLGFWQLVGRRHNTFLARIGADGALLSKNVETKRRAFEVVARHFGGDAATLEALVDAAGTVRLGLEETDVRLRELLRT